MLPSKPGGSFRMQACRLACKMISLLHTAQLDKEERLHDMKVHANATGRMVEFSGGNMRTIAAAMYDAYVLA